MKRIDSTNARPNLNGQGKNGFHDNADLPGQDATYVTPSWCNTIQEEIANAIEGFGQHLDRSNSAQLFSILYALSGRIGLLESQVIEEYKVGDLYITMHNFADGDAVAEHKGYGKWIRYGNGHALVALAHSNNSAAKSWMFNIGNTGGEYDHMLTIAEMPSHSHGVDLSGQDSGGTPARPDGTQRTDQRNVIQTDSTGGSLAHNNVQPSIMVGVWLRVPENYDPTAAVTFLLTANKVSVNEGESITFTLQISDIYYTAPVAYSISGISSSDITNPAYMSSHFNPSNGVATRTITIKDDLLTEGIETLRMSLSLDTNIHVDVKINDTSLTPDVTPETSRVFFAETSDAATDTIGTAIDINMLPDYLVCDPNLSLSAGDEVAISFSTNESGLSLTDVFTTLASTIEVTDPNVNIETLVVWNTDYLTTNDVTGKSFELTFTFAAYSVSYTRAFTFS